MPAYRRSCSFNRRHCDKFNDRCRYRCNLTVTADSSSSSSSSRVTCRDTSSLQSYTFLCLLAMLHVVNLQVAGADVINYRHRSRGARPRPLGSSSWSRIVGLNTHDNNYAPAEKDNPRDAATLSSSFGESPNVLFVSEAEFVAEARQRELDTFFHDIDVDDMRSRTDSASGLGSSLYFDPSKTNLPLQFWMNLKDSENGRGGRTFTLQDNSNDIKQSYNSLPLGIGVLNNGTEMAVSLSTIVHAKSLPFQHVFALGLKISGNKVSSGERISVLDINGKLIREEVGRLPVSDGDVFIGFISSVPFGGITLGQENGDNENNFGIRAVAFSLAESHILDGLPDRDVAYFYSAFNIFVLLMILVDLFLLAGRQNGVSLKSALWWSLAWIFLACSFGYFGVYKYRGAGPGIVWITAYLLEKFLSVDNLFVFLTIFATFKTPTQFQHKALTWGIIGAILLRAVFIFGGVVMIEQFKWLLALCGFFLVWTGYKALVEEDDHCNDHNTLSYSKDYSPEEKIDDNVMDLAHSLPLSIMAKIFPMTNKYDSQGRFFVRSTDSNTSALPVYDTNSRKSRRGSSWIRFPYKATPLFAVLVVIETTDLIFAADSIPAVLSITTDPMIAYTSNIFAVLGLRALYFALSALMQKFCNSKLSDGITS
eukprot:UC4_evm5s293